MALDAAVVQQKLAYAAAGPTAADRGKRYEELLQYVFESVPNTLVVPNVTNYFGAEQVDLAVGHQGGYRSLPSRFLVECKNYDDHVDSKAVGYFLFICLSRSATLAVIAAAHGLTGDAQDSTYAHSLALAASAMGCKIIVITTADLVSLTSADDLVDLLDRRFLTAFANGGIGT